MPATYITITCGYGAAKHTHRLTRTDAIALAGHCPDAEPLGCECEVDWNCPLHGGTSRPTHLERSLDAWASADPDPYDVVSDADLAYERNLWRNSSVTGITERV